MPMFDDGFSASLDDVLEKARADYTARHPRSLERFQRATGYMPGGNTRSVLFYTPFPITLLRGEGSQLWDVDGHQYLDALGEFTAGLYGHTHPVIRAAVVDALENGINLGGHNALESELARLVCERFVSIERFRFTNSGTEANLMAIALAKAYTKRPRILVFSGAYHGSVLTFAGPPSPINVPHDFVVGTYNDIPGVTRLIEENAPHLAAILVEPMLGAGGCIPADAEFLRALRAAATRVGALLILDEVMTSRLSGGGRQKLLELRPDITTLGKYIGGGMSFGAFGGAAQMMALFDPRNPEALPHAGTFNNNVLTMSAGIAALTHIFTPAVADAFRATGDRVRERLNALCRANHAAMHFTGLGSVMNVHFTDQIIRQPADAGATDERLRELFFLDMVEDGIYLARRGLISLMLPMGEREFEQLFKTVEAFLVRRAGYVRSHQPGYR